MPGFFLPRDCTEDSISASELILSIAPGLHQKKTGGLDLKIVAGQWKWPPSAFAAVIERRSKRRQILNECARPSRHSRAMHAPYIIWLLSSVRRSCTSRFVSTGEIDPTNVVVRTHARSEARTSHPRLQNVMTDAEIDAAIAQLEDEMQDLQHRHRDLFAFASAWAQRYDAILAGAPGDRRAAVEQRLHRIGVRWGMITGRRLTGQFPALKQQG